MKNFVDAFIESINKRNPKLLPMANRYYATENGIPAALMLMETYRVIDKVTYVGMVAEDEKTNTAYTVLSVLEGNTPVILGARLTGENDKISEIEINIYRSRSDTGFWFAVQDIEKNEAIWDYVVPEEQRADRAFLEKFAAAIYDNTIDGNLFPTAETCQLMEAGGTVLENVEYAKKLTPNPETLIVPDGAVRIPMGFGLGPGRPAGRDVRVLCIDEKKGLVVVVGNTDGYVSPYIVSDETSSCFVPAQMIQVHRSTLTPETFEGEIACREMMATGEGTVIAKFYDGKIRYYTQNIKIKSYLCGGSWREESFAKDGI